MRFGTAKQQLAGLIALVAIWGVWAKTGGPFLMGTIESGAQPGMEMLSQPDPGAMVREMQKQAASDLRDGLHETIPVGKPAPTPAQKPARVIGSFADDDGINDGYAD